MFFSENMQFGYQYIKMLHISCINSAYILNLVTICLVQMMLLELLMTNINTILTQN